MIAMRRVPICRGEQPACGPAAAAALHRWCFLIDTAAQRGMRPVRFVLCYNQLSMYVYRNGMVRRALVWDCSCGLPRALLRWNENTHIDD